MGNTKGPFTITIALPEGSAIIGENINLQGRFVYFEDSLNPNENKTYSLLFVPSQEGEFEILAALKEEDYITKNSTVVEIFTISAPREKEDFEKSTDESPTSTAPKIIKENITTTVTHTKVLNSTIIVFPIKQKLLFFFLVELDLQEAWPLYSSLLGLLQNLKKGVGGKRYENRHYLGFTKVWRDRASRA